MLHRKILKQNYLCVCVRARARTLKRLKSNDSKEKPIIELSYLRVPWKYRWRRNSELSHQVSPKFKGSRCYPLSAERTQLYMC